MTIQDLNFKLEALMHNIIKAGDYYKSGGLFNSIKFHCSFENGDLKIRYDAFEYIQYINNGWIVDTFNNSMELKSIIEQFYIEYFESLLTRSS